MRAGTEITLDEIDWTEWVVPGDLVVWAQASAEPEPLTLGLMQARQSIGAFRAFAGIPYGASVDTAYTDCVSYTSYCGTGQNRRLGEALDILPIHYGDLAEHLGRQAPVVLVSLGEGASPDWFSYGAAADFIADLMARARLVIASVNAQAPRSSAGQDVRRGEIDLIVSTNIPLPAPPPASFNPTEQKIAAHVAGLIEDGSTLQIGLGSVPAAILNALGDHRDLGFHSGILSGEVADLVDAGVITNARKNLDRDVCVAGLLSGDAGLMRWADRNARLSLRPVSYTHALDVLSQIDRFVALNSAIEVDLSGQVNAELAGGRYVGAVGGAPAFLRGAAVSRGGLGIIAMPSTSRHRSRIVTTLSGPVSTARSDVGLVVTEFGTADLRGASIAQRRDRLLAIAHPDHVASLADAS